VFDENNPNAAALIDQINDPLIKPLIFPTNHKMTLGEKRNTAIDEARGVFFCVWDDDDWHHNRRIEAQVESIIGTECKASVLSSIILADSQSGTYLSATRWGWEQTLCCEKSLFDHHDWTYLTKDRGEDSALIYNLKNSGLLHTLSLPYLYIYVYHGGNVFTRDHWETNLLPWAKELSAEQDLVIRSILKGEIENPMASTSLQNFL
jgi:glycosyltransferase involved in cell wall biosynthesis